MKAVVFDFDNTVEEWLPFEDEVENHLSREVAQKYGLEPVSFKKEFDRIKIDYLKSHSFPQDYGRDTWFSETLAHFGVYDVNVVPIVEHYWNLLVELVQPFPETHETLQKLIDAGYTLAMLSDGDGVVRAYKDRRIKKLGIEDYFSVILTSDELGVNKPNPRLFLEVSSRLGAAPNECIMVGDNPPKDLLSAKELGFVTVWQKQGITARARKLSFTYVDYEVETISEVFSLVTQTIEKK